MESERARGAQQAQPSLLGQAIPLKVVTGVAAGDEVIPVSVAAARARNHMVEAQFRGRELPAAILALVVVAGKDVPPVELDCLPGEFFVAQQANDPRHLDLA